MEKNVRRLLDKKFLLCMIFIYSLCFFCKDVNALEDTTPPTIDASSLKVSNTNATVGDNIKISLSATDAIGSVWGVIIDYIRPLTNNKESFILDYNDETELFEYEFTVDESYQYGIWKIDNIWVSDGENSQIVYNSAISDNCVYSRKCDNFSKGHFTIHDTNPDITYPVIEPSSLSVSHKNVVVGDTVTYMIDISDNVGINYVELDIIDSNKNHEFIRMNYDSSKDKYVGTFVVDESFGTGVWKIYNIYVADTSHNAVLIYNSEYGSSLAEKYNWSNLSIYNYQKYTNPIYKTNSLNLTSSKITSNEATVLSLNATDVFGIDTVNVTYVNPVTNEDYIVEMNKNGDIYSKEIKFDKYGYNGIWNIKKIDIKSTKNILTTINNSNIVQDDKNAIDLSKGTFITYDLIDDFTNPIINDFSISKKSIDINHSAVISIDTIDDNSGVKSVSINYTLPNKTTSTYELEYKDGKYIYMFNYNDYKQSGSYIANYIKVEDYAGNVIYDYKVSNLNCTLRNPIHIISPALYLDTTTSYTMKAVIYPSDKKLTNITWSSSNTAIASINSKTGVLSTKNVEGTVTITAKSKDNLEVYSQITLIVTNAAVKVGDATSLGNSNFIGYSSVEWEIGDETILTPTGKYGTISINNNYRHSIEVKGIKPGKTTVKMMTPAGDLLATSTVYVYDSITSLTSEVKSINTGKNDKISLNVTTSPSNIEERVANLIYVSEDETVAVVDANGIVTTVGGGETNIIVYSQYYNVKLVIPVKVTIPVTEITIKEKEVYLYKESTYKINYSILPIDATNKNIKIENSDSSIISIDQEGNVIPLKNGVSTITISSENGVSSNIKINVIDYIKGDLNKDCKITLSDIIMLLKRYLGTESSTEEDIKIGDMDSNGKIGLKDVILLLRTYLGTN